MYVKIEMTVDVDVDAWASTYGISKGEVRDDVRAYVAMSIQHAGAGPDYEGLIRSVDRKL